MTNKQALDLDLPEAPKKPEMTMVPYEVQAPFSTQIEGITSKYRLHQIVTDPREIKHLLAGRAPIRPVSEEEVNVITCPKCSHQIEVHKVPSVKRWLNSQRGK